MLFDTEFSSIFVDSIGFLKKNRDMPTGTVSERSKAVESAGIVLVAQ
jgi:hypothetical protein